MKIGAPVGRLQLLHLYPLSFAEFLTAVDKTNLLDVILKYELSIKIPEIVHDKILEQLSLYSVLGGMPEVVRTFVKHGRLQDCQDVQSQLVVTYQHDFTKYARQRQVERVSQIFYSVPRLLGQKFKYSHVSTEVRAATLARALDLLVTAGVIYKVNHTSANGVPLGAEAKPTSFKTFFLDSGLALRILQLNLAEWIGTKRDFLINKGQIAEQIVASELITSQRSSEPHDLHYWHRESPGSQAEIDFLFSANGKIIPIEVKSGKSRRSKSLNVFQSERKNIRWLFELSSDLPTQSKTIHYLPLYMASQINRLVTTN